MRPAARWPVTALAVITGWSSACSIDFVALEDASGTSVSVLSQHTDSLRVVVHVRHRGGPPSLTVNGETRSFGIADGGAGAYEAAVAMTLDPLSPVVDIRIDQPATAPLTVRVTPLHRTGEATCDAGGLHLPAGPTGAEREALGTFWTVALFDEADALLTDIDALGHLPDPLVVGGSVVTPSVVRANVRIGTSERIESAPFAAHLSVANEVEWRLAKPCPA